VRRVTVDDLFAQLRDRLADANDRLFVGIDGRSGAGKSTLAGALAAEFAGTCAGRSRVTVIDGDDFYAGGSAETWDRRSPAEKVDRVLDWRRQREVLQVLRGGGVAEWYPFDWDAGDWDRDVAPHQPVPTAAQAGALVVLEGVYSCRPELHDLLDVRVLLDISPEARRSQLLHREGDDYDADWDVRWAAAEDHYFGTVMRPERFELILGPG
jgi:uridine kinase